MALKDNYLTVTEAAKRAGVTRQTFYRWIKQGEFPVEKIGKEILIEKQKFQNYIYAKMRAEVAHLFIDTITIFTQLKYEFNSRDSFELVNIKRNNVFQFHVTKRDGTEETVNVKAVVEMDKKRKQPRAMFDIKKVWKEEHKE